MKNKEKEQLDRLTKALVIINNAIHECKTYEEFREKFMKEMWELVWSDE